MPPCPADIAARRTRDATLPTKNLRRYFVCRQTRCIRTEEVTFLAHPLATTSRVAHLTAKRNVINELHPGRGRQATRGMKKGCIVIPPTVAKDTTRTPRARNRRPPKLSVRTAISRTRFVPLHPIPPRHVPTKISSAFLEAVCW